MRVKSQDPGLYGQPYQLNENDGDRAFSAGDLVENRVDLLSQIDLTQKYYGFRVSGSAWYDTVYNQRNSIPMSGAGTVNWLSAPYNSFPLSTTNVEGRGALLGDAFFQAHGSLGRVRVSARAGQYSMLWGESLILAANAIAGKMVPVNIVKASSVPNSEFQEIVLGVPQVSAQFELTPTFSAQLYYQVMWRKDLFNAAGSYFSTTDTLDAGAERILAGAPGLSPETTPAFFRRADQRAPNTGQYGMALRKRIDSMGLDLGAYYLRFNEKSPQLYLQPGLNAGLQSIGGSAVAGPSIGGYNWTYPTGIQVYGLSAAKSVGDFSVAGEMSLRSNQDLASNGASTSVSGVFGPPGTPRATLNLACPYNDPTYLARFPANGAPLILSSVAINNTTNPCYAVGNTLHANGNFLWQVPPNFITKDSSLLFEVGWNHLLGITANPWMLDAAYVTRNATAVALVYTPTFHQVVPRLEVTVPVTLSMGLQGQSAVYDSLPAGGVGTASIAINGVYDQKWIYGISYTKFFGPKGPQNDAASSLSQQQALADRDFVAVSLSRTF